jgi:murein DD-endopeptidase MepM/ murein hydrolase activator NlpD
VRREAASLTLLAGAALLLAGIPGASLAQSTVDSTEGTTVETEPEPALEPHDYGSRRMNLGDSGTDVAKLQEYLTRQGLETPATGYFGDLTQGNVERWEAWLYRRADGEVSRSQAQRIELLAVEGAAYEKRNHVFPVRGPHDFGGAGSRFGAPRGDHRHKGQDIAAAHGTKLVAAHSGTVSYRQYQASGAGYYLVIRGRDDSDSVYMHMARPAKVGPGERVLAGEVIGKVGNTGASYGAHLHFELWTPHWWAGGKPYDPLPKLLRWDSKT